VSQVLEPTGDAGKTYTPASWLPTLRISGRPRPASTLQEDAVTIFLAAFTLAALFWDGLRHNGLTGVDNFFSPPHIAMYAGLTGLGVWIAIVLLRYQKGLDDLDFSLVPRGYTLAFVALPLAAIAGPADFIWHEAYGFENQIDSTFSPPHQGLFYAGAMLAAIPVASAWQRRETAPSLREFLPAVFSMTSVIAAMLFVVHQMVPFYGGGVVATQAFQDDIAGRADAFSPGADAVHTEGLARALTHYGDEAFPYYFFSTHLGVAGILLFTIALMGGILMLRRRWRLPAGSLTVMGTFLALLWPMLSEYREAELIPTLVLGGVIGDLLLARLAGSAGPTRVGRVRLFAALMPPVVWALFFLCVEFLQDGLGWEPTLWVGLLATTAGLGWAMSLLIFSPFSGAVTEQVPEALSTDRGSLA
jgi:hypothetical protein